MKQSVEEAAVDFADYELKNLDKLTQDTFFMSYSPLPIYGLDSCPIRAYAIEGLAEFSR